MYFKYYLLYLFTFIFLVLLSSYSKNNTCKSYTSYLNLMFSNDCYYNPDVDDNVIQILERYTGTHETHEVKTEDGYILTLFRLPKKDPKDVILLQHSMLSDSKLWVGQFNESVAFLFWQAGYEIWLGNARGTFYSQKHVTLNSTDPSFWNYSFHEIGYYDQPAAINYIKEKTSRTKIIYLGFSMGGTVGLVYASTRPREAEESLKLMITVSPVTHPKKMESLLKDIAPHFFSLQAFDMHYTVLRYAELFALFHRYFPFKKYLPYVLSPLAGHTLDEFDPTFSNSFASIICGETPLKLLHHFNQLFEAGGQFQMYDYGEKNLEFYGQEKPPLYPLNEIRVPIFLTVSHNDSISDDNAVLLSLLPKRSKIYGNLIVEGLNHVDFFFGKHRNEKVYHKILKLLDRISLN